MVTSKTLQGEFQQSSIFSHVSEDLEIIFFVGVVCEVFAFLWISHWYNFGACLSLFFSHQDKLLNFNWFSRCSFVVVFFKSKCLLFYYVLMLKAVLCQWREVQTLLACRSQKCFNDISIGRHLYLLSSCLCFSVLIVGGYFIRQGKGLKILSMSDVRLEQAVLHI